MNDTIKEIFEDRLFGNFKLTYKYSKDYIGANSEIKDLIEDIEFFASYIITQCYPSDFESIKKIWWFPLVEAGDELEYSLFFAKGGIYKTAYICLRNFMELSLNCFYFLMNEIPKGNQWINGKLSTPFMSEIKAGLFKKSDFVKFNSELNIEQRIDDLYSKLSNVCHTRGEPCSHMRMSKANYPRFIQESFHEYLSIVKQVIDIVITCFVIVNPIIIYPIPIEEKFGMDGPLSGYLEKGEVELIRNFLKSDALNKLYSYYDSDPAVQSLRNYISELPNITEEKLRQQLEEWENFMGEMNRKNVKYKSNS